MAFPHIFSQKRIANANTFALSKCRSEDWQVRAGSGHTVGNFQLINKIGQGGMGAVHLAHHPKLDWADVRWTSSATIQIRGTKTRASKRIIPLAEAEARAVAAA